MGLGYFEVSHQLPAPDARVVHDHHVGARLARRPGRRLALLVRGLQLGRVKPVLTLLGCEEGVRGANLKIYEN